MNKFILVFSQVYLVQTTFFMNNVLLIGQMFRCVVRNSEASGTEYTQSSIYDAADVLDM
jgi:hypothetical protein